MGIDRPTKYKNPAENEQEAHWQEIVEIAFEVAGLPEVDPSQLEIGTYTNAQIAEKLRGDTGRLLTLLRRVSNLGNEAAKRNILSIAVDKCLQK